MGKGRVIFYPLWFIFALTWFVYSTPQDAPIDT